MMVAALVRLVPEHVEDLGLIVTSSAVVAGRR